MLLKDARYSTNEPSDPSLTLIYDTFGYEILLSKEKFKYSTSKISVVFYIFIQNSSFEMVNTVKVSRLSSPFKLYKIYTSWKICTGNMYRKP